MHRRYFIRRALFVFLLILLPLSLYLAFRSSSDGVLQETIRNEVKITATLLPVKVSEPVRFFIDIESTQHPDIIAQNPMDLVLLMDGNKVPYKPISFKEKKRSDSGVSGILTFPSFDKLPKELSLIVYELEARIFVWQLP